MMAMTAEEARELHDTIGESRWAIEGWRLGNITAEEALEVAAEVLERIDAAARRVLTAGGAPDPALARLDAMTEAVRVLCHDLRDGATVLLATAGLVRRYAERGKRDDDPAMFDRSAAKAELLMELVRERVAAIQAGEARALGVGRTVEEAAALTGPLTDLDPPALRPELREAAERSWQRGEAASRYLAREGDEEHEPPVLGGPDEAR